MTKNRNGLGRALAGELVKWLASLLASALLLLACVWLYHDAESRPAEEVYVGSAQEVVATITVSQGRIVDVKLVGPKDTSPAGRKALEELPGRILQAQSPEVDGFAGATLTADAAKAAVADAMVQAGLLPAPKQADAGEAPVQ